MAIFATDLHKGKRIRARLEIVTSIEYTEKPWPLATGCAVARVVGDVDRDWYTIVYDPDNIDDNRAYAYGRETYAWSMYFRFVVKMLSNYNQAQKEAKDEKVRKR